MKSFYDEIKKYLGAAVGWLVAAFAGSLSDRWRLRFGVRLYRAGVRGAQERFRVPFSADNLQVPMRDNYIPIRLRVRDEERTSESVIESSRRTVVLGEPGAGKSLLLRNSMLLWADGVTSGWDGAQVPVLVELSRCSDNTEPLETHVRQALRDGRMPAPSPRFVTRSLEKGRLRLLFDGLDEVTSGERGRVIGMLNDFAARYASCGVVVSCRTAIYDGQLDDRFDQTARVAQFAEAQIRRFLRAWPGMPPEGVGQLMDALHRAPNIQRLAANPLLLTMIASLYTADEARENFKLPNSRASFYEEATDFMLRHKSGRIDRRPHKKAILQHIALRLQEAHRGTADRRSLPFLTVLADVAELLERELNLPSDEAAGLLEELRERSELILRIDRGERLQFPHTTLQEFFAARALAADPESLTERLARDPEAWREPVKLWFGLADADATAALRRVDELDPLLAFECLGDTVHVDEAFAWKLVERSLGELGQGDSALVAAFGAVAGDRRPRGRRVFDALVAIARDAADVWRGDAILALAATRLPEAAAVLVEFAADVPGVRRALVEMGDLAVRTLHERALNGSLDAVDDLGAIATPHAAEALANLLGSIDLPIDLLDSDGRQVVEVLNRRRLLPGGTPSVSLKWSSEFRYFTVTPVARRAAWWVASLLSSPDTADALAEAAAGRGWPLSDEVAAIEESLKSAVRSRTRETQWVAAPFSKDSPELAALITKVAELLISSTLEEIPVPFPPLDARLSLPLAGVGLSEWREGAGKNADLNNARSYFAGLEQHGTPAEREVWRLLSGEIESLLGDSTLPSEGDLRLSAVAYTARDESRDWPRENFLFWMEIFGRRRAPDPDDQRVLHQRFETSGVPAPIMTMMAGFDEGFRHTVMTATDVNSSRRLTRADWRRVRDPRDFHAGGHILALALLFVPMLLLALAGALGAITETAWLSAATLEFGIVATVCLIVSALVLVRTLMDQADWDPGIVDDLWDVFLADDGGIIGIGVGAAGVTLLNGVVLSLHLFGTLWTITGGVALLAVLVLAAVLAEMTGRLTTVVFAVVLLVSFGGGLAMAVLTIQGSPLGWGSTGYGWVSIVLTSGLAIYGSGVLLDDTGREFTWLDTIMDGFDAIDDWTDFTFDTTHLGAVFVLVTSGVTLVAAGTPIQQSFGWPVTLAAGALWAAAVAAVSLDIWRRRRRVHNPFHGLLERADGSFTR
ncbi:NACHT domain-containing protein [Acrocarpospora phusangensis]|uniref:NACHT domain-containing protein n=1 Tax=Acrocarpospora phusangensis TaxID=1070424 RepID=UPI0019500BA5|nr:NACHT domain-containing protein [Acrocarpospora phusangensis]